MDSFEINKIVAAVLLVALLVIGIGKISNLLFNVEKPEVSGYKVEVSEEVSKKSVAQKEEKVEVDISALMAQADLAHGEKIFKKCSACHSIQAGGGKQNWTSFIQCCGKKSCCSRRLQIFKSTCCSHKKLDFWRIEWLFNQTSSLDKRY